MIPRDCDLHGEQMHFVEFTKYDPNTRFIHFRMWCEHCPEFIQYGHATPMDWLRLLVELRADESPQAN